MSLLKSRHVALEGSILKKKSVGVDGWDSCAVFAVDSGDVEYTVRVGSASCRGKVNAMVGFAPSSINVNIDNLHTSCGYYLFLQNGLLFYGDTGFLYGDTGSIGQPGLGSGLAVGQTLRLRLATLPRLTISAAVLNANSGFDFQTLNFPQLPVADYRPCILLRDNNITLEVSIDTVPDCPDPNQYRAKLHGMWKDTSFSDCRIVCGDKILPCHRVVLATASPVWRTALESSFREGQEATINIVDADASDVEALLQYAYTMEIDAAKAAALLPLAHRYEMPELVGCCGRLLLNRLSASNVAHTVSALSIFSEHENVAPVWSKLVEKVRSDADLAEAALRHVRP